MTSEKSRAVAKKGWLRSNKWLLLRRTSQITITVLFLIGPWFGIWWFKGNIATSLFLDTVPLTDPLIALQSWIAGHIIVKTALIGTVIIILFYLLVGGRVYCSWVCPINLITDAAEWLRRRMGITTQWHFLKRITRRWLLVTIIIMSALTGTIAWEFVNPITMLNRELLYGMGFVWVLVSAIFLFDLFITRRGWCSYLCPVGEFYGLLGRFSVVRASAKKRHLCDDCGDCFVTCPEPHVITPALDRANYGVGPVIMLGDCTNCGRCIDVCHADVFGVSTRFHNALPEITQAEIQQEPEIGAAVKTSIV
jgi:ferredoxin-type protein NapH